MAVSLRPRTTADPAVIEWVTSASVPEGWSDSLPPSLAVLIEDRTLAAVEVTPGIIRTRAGDHQTWAAIAPGVRRALGRELTAVADAELEQVARELAAGPLLAATHAHGGAITVERVKRGVVEVSTQGACHGCPAVGATLGQYFTTLLRERGVHVTEVREV